MSPLQSQMSVKNCSVFHDNGLALASKTGEEIRILDMESSRSFVHRFFRNRLLQTLVISLIGMVVGASASHFLPWQPSSTRPVSEIGTRMRPGPWGELYYIPFSIAAPEELLPIRALEAEGTHWLFKDFSLSQLTHFFDSMELPTDLQYALLEPAIAHVKPSGVELTPTPAMVVALPAAARQVIYRQLAQFFENRSIFSFIHKSTLGDRFDGSGISGQTLALFHTLSCEHGDYLVFGGLSAMLSQLPDYEEKVRFMKALTRQKTMLLRLNLTRNSDLGALAGYWGRGSWATNTRTILESIQRVPGGAYTDVRALLPPMPASQLYDYPVDQPTSLNDDAPQRDCHWTSLNFFRDTAALEPVDPALFAKEITERCYPSFGDPRYGDILVLANPNGNIVHSAVFIADDVVFTKNGATAIYPWMFSTIPDLLKQYSFLAPDGQQLVLHYFRNKTL